jgi:glycosyltransferase involved in cell wall biosynthesis
MATPFLSVVIPSYNEKSNLDRQVLAEVADYLNKQAYSWEVILSDDGSTDGTVEALQSFAQSHPGFRVMANQHAGKGPTVKKGMLAATGAWRLFTDFDQSTPIAELEKLLSFAETHQVICGSREVTGAMRDKEPLLRHVMGRVFNLVVQIFAVPNIQDTQCGFKLFSQKATEELFPRLSIYGGDKPMKDAFTGAFDVELLFLARKFNFAIAEVAILWRHYKSDRVSPLKDSYRMFRDILRIRLAYLMGAYAK